VSGDTFFIGCEAYFEGTLKAELQKAIDSWMRKSEKKRVVYLSITDDPKVVCLVKKIVEDVFEIQLSKVFLHRLAIFSKCRHAVWESAAHNSRLFAFDNDHPYDSHVWDYPRDDRYPFSLQVGFRGYLSVNHGVEKIKDFSDFIERFNSNTDNGFHGLNFKLKDCLDPEVLDILRVFSLFLVMHELAHILFPHALFLQMWPYRNIQRRTALAGTIFRYRHKAIELDADFRGALMAFSFEFGEKPTVRDTQFFLTCIACGFSIFDMDRRNTFDRKSFDGLYPLPEIRFDAMVFSLVGWNNSLKKLRDAVMTDLICSAQMLGLFGGPFYLYSGPITSLDRQFLKEVQILETVRRELERIIIQINEYYGQTTNPFPKIGDEWRIDPIGMDEEGFKHKFTIEAQNIFSGKYNNITMDKHLENRSAELQRLSESGIIRKGDVIVFALDPTEDIRPEMKIHMSPMNEEQPFP